jgi:hypothetical protein
MTRPVGVEKVSPNGLISMAVQGVCRIVWPRCFGCLLSKDERSDRQTAAGIAEAARSMTHTLSLLELGSAFRAADTGQDGSS